MEENKFFKTDGIQELNLDDLEGIAGGLLEFYTVIGYGYVKVIDGPYAGTYNCKPDCWGALDYSKLTTEYPGLSQDEYVKMAIDRGIFWKDKK